MKNAKRYTVYYATNYLDRSETLVVNADNELQARIKAGTILKGMDETLALPKEILNLGVEQIHHKITGVCPIYG